MILFDTKYLQLKSTKSVTGNDWVYAHRPNTNGVVVILPIIENDKILFITEERPPIFAEYGSRRTIGLPAGLVGDIRKGETIEDAIKAELLEEAGLEANEIKILAKDVASSAGCTSETFTIALAKINNYRIVNEPINDGGIIVERTLVKISEIDDWFRKQQKDNCILTAQMLSALYYLKEV